MASEYLRKKAREEAKPREVIELTPREKRRNWWHYHKLHVIVGIVLIAILGNMLWHTLGIGRVDPDYTVAYVGHTPLQTETEEALKAGLAALSPDLNGDGRVVVQLLQYVTSTSDEADAAYLNQASIIKLSGDVSTNQSYFFLMEDPEEFQLMTGGVLRMLDGTLPEREDMTAEGKAVLWGSCPALAGIDFGADQEFMAGLAFGRRGYWRTQTGANNAGCDALWEIFTAQ